MSYSVLADALEPSLPPVLWRKMWPEYQTNLGVPFARGTMQNLDSSGQGPKAGRVAGRVFYKKTDYLDWLRGLGKSDPGHGAA
jgi:hypothetical protein